jgi:hypothetical protein
LHEIQSQSIRSIVPCRWNADRAVDGKSFSADCVAYAANGNSDAANGNADAGNNSTRGNNAGTLDDQPANHTAESGHAEFNDAKHGVTNNDSHRYDTGRCHAWFIHIAEYGEPGRRTVPNNRVQFRNDDFIAHNGAGIEFVCFDNAGIGFVIDYVGEPLSADATQQYDTRSTIEVV